MQNACHHVLKSIAWALGSAFSAFAAIAEQSLPIMQFIGCVAAITAAFFSIRASKAAIKKARNE